MFDQEVIIRKVDSIQNCLQRIVQKTQDNANWMTDYDARDIVVLHLVRAIQLCVDIAGYIISERQWGIPGLLEIHFIS